MSPIFFCSHAKDKFRRELTQVQREVAHDQDKRARDEHKRKTNFANQTSTILDKIYGQS